MGAGIVEVAALAGLTTVLYDVITHPTMFEDLKTCDLIIEAIPEDMALKLDLFRKLDALCPPETCFASNTSSLSITAMAEATQRPSQVAGMHFFNPVPKMKLVEIISTPYTTAELSQQLDQLATAMGKTPVHVKDTPGFIVNRVARPFYLEALRMLETGCADVETIDVAMREGGFKMGPFELMDLIGLDVNYAVTQSVYHAFEDAERFKPSPIQQQLVEAGHLGRKTGQGFYRYDAMPPQPVFPSTTSLLTSSDIVRHIYTHLSNEAALAVQEGIATEQDIDTAMKLGTRYPLGPCEWARQNAPLHNPK
jgi:3-hydroxybutyryl-CoA dehydrogenase